MNRDASKDLLPSPLLPYAELLLFGGLALWLLWAASVVRIDYYDTWDTLLNARFFLGLNPHFNNMRAPGMAWLMLPVEWLKLQLDLQPADLRINHLLMAVLHFAMLLGSYLGLLHIGGRRWSSYWAFVIATFSYLFFAYLPFVSHDILPGVLLLWMLIAARRMFRHYKYKYMILLVIFTSLAALIKHTYALLWLALLLLYLLRALWTRQRGDWMHWLRLLGLASLSGLLVWLAFAFAFSHDFADSAFLLRPLAGLRDTFAQFGTTDTGERKIYLINFLVYGAASVPLVLAGFLSLLERGEAKGDAYSLSCDVAFVVLFFFLVMPLLGLRELRYLLFLTPLYAVLIASSLRALSRRRAWRQASMVAVGLLFGLQLFGWPLAVYSWPSAFLSLRQPARAFAQGSSLLPILQRLQKNRGPIAVYTPKRQAAISLMDDALLPVWGDSFHGIFQLSADHLAMLTGRRVMINFDPRKIEQKAGLQIVDIVVNQQFAVHQLHPPGICLQHAKKVLTWIGRLARDPLRLAEPGQNTANHDRGWFVTDDGGSSAVCRPLRPASALRGAVPLAWADLAKTDKSWPVPVNASCLPLQGQVLARARQHQIVIYSALPDMVLRLGNQQWRQLELRRADLCPKR